MDFFRLGQDVGDQGSCLEGESSQGLEEEEQGKAGRVDPDGGAASQTTGGRGSSVFSKDRDSGGAGRCCFGAGAASRSGGGAAGSCGSPGGGDRGRMGLAGEAVVEVKVCIKIGSRICSEDCFASGF